MGMMMKIDIKNLENQKKEMRIEADWGDLETDYDDLLSEYLKVPVPGFRPGRAPRGIVEKRFRKEILDDVSARCAQRLSKQSLEDEGIMAGSHISITDIQIEKGEPFSFTAEFTEIPEFELPDYPALKLSSETDEEKRDEISEWMLNQTQVEVPDEIVKQELEFGDNAEAGKGSDEWNAACQRVKLLLVLRKIAREDGIEVDDTDVDDRIEQIASGCDTTASQLRQTLLSTGGLSRISSFLLAEKTLDYLIEVCG
jgi:FKBP-type peptidyl-prolyl cis-trans isomerase (trigger factor)